MADDLISQARNDLVGRAITLDDPDAVGVFVIMYDERQQVCAVFARDADHAREIIGDMLGGVDMSDQPVYDVAKDDDVQAIINIIVQHIGG